MSTFQRYFLLTLFCILLTTVGFAAGFILNPQSISRSRDFPILGEAYSILSQDGLTPVSDTPNLEYGSIRGMLQAYGDPYTIFVEPAQHELETNSLEGSFGGIGVRFGRDAEEQLVLYPFPGSPAQGAGVSDGDRLLAVGDLVVNKDTPIDKIQAALRGPVGTKAQVTIAHAPDYEAVELSIKRAEFPVPSVAWHREASEPRLGVVEVNMISANTPNEISGAIQTLRNQGATKFVLDLRDNGGGLLSAGIDTARLFLKDGVIIQQRYRDKEVETYRVDKQGEFADIPLAVLINENTASAAEIIAGALQVNQRARLIGAHSYGKDTIQLVYDLQDGSSLHVTTARWWVPGLEPPIAGNGLQPDIPVAAQASESGADAMLRAAIKELFNSGETWNH
jgi:carboxyl-terminal processing protease